MGFEVAADLEGGGAARAAERRARVGRASVALLAALGAAGVQAHDAPTPPGQERCYGIAKAGQNACANLRGSHGCAGLSKVDFDPGEWVFVAKGTCRKLKGLNEAQARARLQAPAAQPRPAAPAR
jgi:uncharacterized membrane protein